MHRALAAPAAALVLLLATPALAADVELAVRLTEYGVAKQEAGDHVAARAYFDRALREVDHPKIRYFLGKSLRALGHLEAALAEFHQIQGDGRVGKYAEEIAAFITAIEGEQAREALEEQLEAERRARERAEEQTRRLAEEKRQALEQEARQRTAREAAERVAGQRARELEEARQAGEGSREGDRDEGVLDEPAAPLRPGAPVPPWHRRAPGPEAPAPGAGEGEDLPDDVEPAGTGGPRDVEPTPAPGRKKSVVRREDAPDAARSRPAETARKQDPAVARYESERLAAKVMVITGLVSVATGVALAWNPLDREGDSASDTVKRTGRIMLGAGAGALVLGWALWPSKQPASGRRHVADGLRVAPSVGPGAAGLVLGGGF